MTKKELRHKLNLAISQEEWERLQRGELPISDFNNSTLKEMKQESTDGDESFVDEQLAKELSQVLKDYLSRHLPDKPLAWKYIIISSIYLTYIAERPMHPMEKLEIKVTEDKEGRIYECPNKSSKRDTSCHFCVCKKLSNYEIAKRKTQKQFYQYNHEEIAGKLRIPLENGYLYLKFLNRSYRVHCQTGCVEWSENDFADVKEADFNEVMTIYDILCYSKKGAAPSNEFALIQRLSSVQNAASYAGEGSFKKDEAFFDGKAELLVQALERLNGKPYVKGDVSFRIPVFQSLDVIFSFWNSDEDFPAQIQFLCDKNTLQYMHYETIWYLISHIIGRIKEMCNP
ncbi:DUF3786 domain-containing protein [Candidatus Merdisoma sp. JLR.KK006]|uniref:DUF3786 domain-containing protein n=1 Tax=Candidatus Merdisoma sp. JLR.KK006 TaxID=3112626 RepID=UPI002FF2B223